MKFSLAISTDRRLCSMQIEQAPKPDEVLSAQDLEGLISHFAAQRERMLPAADEAPGLMQGGAVATDAVSPKLDLALLQQGQSFVVLAVAYPGLGWRNLAMTLPEAEALGRRLLAMSAQ